MCTAVDHICLTLEGLWRQRVRNRECGFLLRRSCSKVPRLWNRHCSFRRSAHFYSPHMLSSYPQQEPQIATTPPQPRQKNQSSRPLVFLSICLASDKHPQFASRISGNLSEDVLTNASWATSFIDRLVSNLLTCKARGSVHLQAIMSGSGRLAPRRRENANFPDPEKGTTPEGRICILIVHVIIRFIVGKLLISHLLGWRLS